MVPIRFLAARCRPRRRWSARAIDEFGFATARGAAIRQHDVAATPNQPGRFNCAADACLRLSGDSDRCTATVPGQRSLKAQL